MLLMTVISVEGQMFYHLGKTCSSIYKDAWSLKCDCLIFIRKLMTITFDNIFYLEIFNVNNYISCISLV